MSYTDITTRKSFLLKDFKQIEDSKGSYIRTKYKNSKRVVSEYNIELEFYHLPAKELASCFKNIFKNTHEYRIKKLYDLQQSNMYEIFLCLKDINEQENNNFVFKVSSHDSLMEKLNYLLTDTQEVFINKEMYVFFDKYRNDKKNIQQLINTEKLGKIRQDDFIVVINKILKVIDTPKELKYMINLLNEIATKKIFTEETFNCFYKTINNKLIKYLNNIINHNIDNKKLSEKHILKQIHACLVVLDEQKQNLPKKIKKKLLDETLSLYDCFIKNINFDITDTAFISRQKKANENLIENIIKKIINAIAEAPGTVNKSIDKKYDYKKNLAYNIINQTQISVNGLEYFIQETKSCFNLLTDTMQQILASDWLRQAFNYDFIPIGIRNCPIR